jgi:transcriptional regulator with XRE-family HTH domain
MDVATMLRGARQRAGLTQGELARRAGTSQATISAYENATKQPSVETLARLLDATGSELAVRVREPRLPGRTAAELARAGRILLDVLGLAEALPVHHEPALRYPRLGPPPGHRA